MNNRKSFRTDGYLSDAKGRVQWSDFFEDIDSESACCWSTAAQHDQSQTLHHMQNRPEMRSLQRERWALKNTWKNTMLNYKLKIYDKLQYKNKTIKIIQKLGVGKTF